MLHSTEGSSLACFLKVSIFQDDHGSFATELLKDQALSKKRYSDTYLQYSGLEILRTKRADDLAYGSTSCEVHSLYCWMFDHGFCDLGGGRPWTAYEVQHTIRQASFPVKA